MQSAFVQALLHALKTIPLFSQTNLHQVQRQNQQIEVLYETEESSRSANEVKRLIMMGFNDFKTLALI